MAMAATFWATALLMAAVCFCTSPPLSRTMTLKPYLAAFFWYIFQEYAWDGFCCWAMNASVGRPAAADGAPPEAGAEVLVPLPQALTTIATTERAAIENRLRIICVSFPHNWARGSHDRLRARRRR